MSGSAGNTASGAPEQGGEIILSLSTVQRMLPLVQRIVEDILRLQKVANALQPEQERLHRQRRTLTWPQRQRRYQLQEEAADSERGLQEAFQELQELGVALLDPETGRVGFPTRVNDRPAFFSWRLNEDGLHYWHFADDGVLRPIPPAWMKELSWVSEKL